MSSICVNGKMILSDEPVLLAANRGYRYGDGVFETMKIVAGKIRLRDYHFERLFAALSLLKFELPAFFSPVKLEQEILQLCQKNSCEKLARVRLSVSRGNGGLYDEDRTLQYIIECWPLNDPIDQLNKNGLVIDIYTGATKNCDQFANLKSASFLPYSMAAIFAREQRLNDCLVLNSKGGIADSTIANVFMIREGIIFTPALSEGCVGGVMRRYLLEGLGVMGYELRETTVTEQDLYVADEIFLTNAIKGMNWVKQFRDKTYSNKLSTEIYNRMIQTI